MRAVTKWWKGRVSIIFFILLLVSSVLLLDHFQKNNSVQAQENFKVVGYYTSWGPPGNLNPNNITHINFAFADVCWDGEHGNPEVWVPEGESNTWACTDLQGNEAEIPNGSVVLGDPESDIRALQTLRELKQINPDLKTLVSIGGWSWSYNISLAARTEESRKIFAESAVAYIREFGMDGVDLDWEYPVEGGMWNNHRDPSDKENHTLLLKEIRQALDNAEAEDGKEYLLTIASSVSFSYPTNNELDKIAEIVDYINIMTYDFNGTWAPMSAHNAPLYEDPQAVEANVHPYHIDQAINGHLNAGVPANKLVMGLPFYGRSWGNCNQDNNGEMTTINGGYQLCEGNGGGDLEPGVYSYDYIRGNLVNKNGFKYYWNNNAKVPYLYNDEIGEFITFDNVESIGYKVNYIKEKGLAGAMIWELSQDDEEYNLLKTVSSGLGISNEQPKPEPEEPEDGDGTEDDEDKGKEDGTEEDEDKGKEDGTEEDEDKGKEDGTEEDEDKGKEDGTEEDEDKDTDDDSEDNGDKDKEDDSDKNEDKDNSLENNGETGKDNNGSKESGQKLPATATNMFNTLAVGALIIIIGFGIYYFQRRKRRKVK
ncbi:glycoside hydrolase family 18 protein [Pseudogracilibacillus sp. SE30717A]|uniref:glycoside hydrolase family 18 protein n=1 Tax=Pseudogracilibacillus sp. SE30717A TaxID=3098293 RepID=UPI00300DE440